MTKRAQQRRTESNKLNRVPVETDWGDYRADIDQKWAHDYYIGKSIDDMHRHFFRSPIEAISEIRFMPEIPFRYYLRGFAKIFDYTFFGDELTDAASCFIRLVRDKLESDPRYIVAIMPELLLPLEKIAHNQSWYDANENIYGSFQHAFHRIQELYSVAKDRYRRYL